MNAEHRKEQEEAHRRDFEIHWQDVVVPVCQESGLSNERIAGMKEGAWGSWLADDEVARLLEQYPPPD